MYNPKPYIGIYLSYQLVDQTAHNKYSGWRKQLYDLLGTNRLIRGGNVHLSREILPSIIEISLKGCDHR
jgi:hypothetical protein